MSVQQQATKDDFRRLQRMAAMPPRLQEMPRAEVPTAAPRLRRDNLKQLSRELRDRLRGMPREQEPK